MTKIQRFSSLQLLPCLLFYSFSLLFIPGLADSPSTSSSTNETSKKTSGNSTGLKIVMVSLGLLAIVGFSVFLYKLWQRKKRDQQHARLLKLFEQDDDLELELGIRD